VQVVGGGPELDNAPLIVLDADAESLCVVVQDLSGKELAQRRLT
jgi:hypothetical protein